MHNLAQPSILALASFTPALALLNTDLSTIAQQISAVGIMAYFLWRETKHNRELKEEIKELNKIIIELLKSKEDREREK